jgi:hypothetical protein
VLVPFPQNVKDDALIACGRHCVLCHRHVTLKIECHHIVLEEKGGPNTLDNCIPLCFDCHADMRGYDFKHPKGNKYSEKELRTRRDNWYKRYADTGAAVASPEHLALDRQTFLRFRQRLPYGEVIRPLQERYNGAPMRNPWYNRLALLAEEPLDVADEYLDADLESLRAQLSDAIEEFVDTTVDWLFSRDRGEGFWLPDELKYRDNNEYIRQSSEIDRLSAALIEAYEGLVRQGRKKLGVDVESTGT